MRQTRYEDSAYQESAVYHVRPRREYSASGTGLRTRVSGRVRASVTVISAEERIEGVVYNGGTSRSLNASTTCMTATIPSLRKPIHPVCPLRWMKACWDRIASAHLALNR